MKFEFCEIRFLFFNIRKKLDGPELDGPELFRKKCQKVSKSAQKFQLILDHFQSLQQINQILQLKYYLHRFAVHLVL